MSQYYRDAESSTPSIPTQFTADDATVAVPVGNNLNLFARDTPENNDNGIQTTADPNGGEDFYVELTNRIQNGASTIGATTADIGVADFSLSPYAGTAGTYSFEFNIAAFDSGTPSGGTYTLVGAVRTDGATPTLIGGELANQFEEATLNDSAIELALDGTELVVRVTGVAGVTIAWDIVGLYTRSI